MMGVTPVSGPSRALDTVLLASVFCLSAAVPDLEPHKLHLVGAAHKAKDRQDTDIVFDSDTNEGLIGQLFGQNLQSFPESTCQIEYMDILGGDMNDGRLPGQRTRWRHSQILIWKFISQSCKGHPSSARNGVKIRRAAVSLRGIGDWA